MSALTVHLPFVGFTFTNSSCLSDNPPSSREGSKGASKALEDVSCWKAENSALQAEVEELKKQVASAGGLKADRKSHQEGGVGIRAAV